ncbi:hypothetical protein FH603_5498 [Spirosoma sp. LMG 31447]|uniref:Uncharacterized protein n=1 Tax=Spirosoma utsteinense TaxID=2585773 RepID=A0ABR6WFZ8_9BACT|nr:hypothetical protein [Spirosoma utsteinense]
MYKILLYLPFLGISRLAIGQVTYSDTTIRGRYLTAISFYADYKGFSVSETRTNQSTKVSEYELVSSSTNTLDVDSTSYGHQSNGYVWIRLRAVIPCYFFYSKSVSTNGKPGKYIDGTVREWTVILPYHKAKAVLRELW